MVIFISPKFGLKPGTVQLIQAARTKGIETNTLLNSWRYDEKELNVKSFIHGAPYGEHSFCDFIAQEMKWNLFQNSFDWVAKLPTGLLKRHIKYSTIREAKELDKNQLIINNKVLESVGDPLFMTAIHGKFPDVPPETPILIHSDVEWIVKYRFVIINGKIATFCCYRVFSLFNTPSIWNNSFKGENTTAEAFVQTILNHFETAPACILDVGFIKDTGWSVVGTYPIWTSDLYGCDPFEFIKGIFTACKPIAQS